MCFIRRNWSIPYKLDNRTKRLLALYERYFKPIYSNIPKHTCNKSHIVKPFYYTKQKRSLNRNIIKPHNKRENYE